MTSPSHSRAGFTLVELLVGMSLALVVMTGVLSTFAFLGRNLNRLANQQQLESEARRALAYFAQDVRMASGLETQTSTTPTSPSNTTITLNRRTSFGTRKIIYFFNNSDSASTQNINSIVILAPPKSLVRFFEADATPNTGNTLTLISNLIESTESGIEPSQFSYMDLNGTRLDPASSTFIQKVPSIKRVSMELRSQTGVAANGTLTPVYSCASPFLTIRNKALLE